MREFFLVFSERRTFPRVTLQTVSTAIKLPFPVGWGLSNESVVSRERRDGVVRRDEQGCLEGRMWNELRPLQHSAHHS